MSDHIDGPRQIGDPAADLTDLFAFTSPANPAPTVPGKSVQKYPDIKTGADFTGYKKLPH